MTRRDTPLTALTPVIPAHLFYPGLSLAQILSIIWAHWKLSALIVLTVVALSALLMTLWPRTYTATVTLVVNYEVTDPQYGRELPLGQVGSYIATQVELMHTPGVLLAVVDRLRLTQDKEFSRGYSDGGGTLREWVAQTLNTNLAIYQGQMGSQLIYVTYSAHDPAKAALIANTVADVYVEQDYLRSSGPSSARAERYAQQLTDLRGKVTQAQSQVTAFRQSNDLLAEGDSASGDAALLGSLEGRLQEAQTARRVAEAQASGDQSVSDQALSSSLVQSLQSQLADQNVRMAQLNNAYTPQHPAIAELQSQMAATRGSLASALHYYSANALAGLQTAQRLEQSLQRAVQQQRVKVLASDQLRDQAATYLLELESAQTVSKRALENYDHILFTSGHERPNVSFVSRATPPVTASKPRLLKGLLLGAMTAAFLGLGLPLSRELLNRRVRCRDDLERHLGIPVLVDFRTLSARTTA